MTGYRYEWRVLTVRISIGSKGWSAAGNREKNLFAEECALCFQINRLNDAKDYKSVEAYWNLCCL